MNVTIFLPFFTFAFEKFTFAFESFQKKPYLRICSTNVLAIFRESPKTRSADLV